MTILSLPLATAQKKVKVDDKVRAIEYHVLSEQENSGFFRKNQELSRIILEAALGDEITAYQIDYDKGTEIVISPSALKTRLQKINEPGLDEIYQPDEVSLIGLDVTEGHQGDQVFRQYNFLNLYVPYYSSTTQNLYIASFLFEDVVALLDNRNALWYAESFVLSRGIFSNHAGHELNKTSWTKYLLEDIKLGHLNARFNAGVNISGYQAIDGYDLELRLQETFEGKKFIIEAIELHKSREDSIAFEDLFICSISFKDLKTYLSDEDQDGISLMSEAILKRRLSSPSEIFRNEFENFYDSNFTDGEVISQNGKFMDCEKADHHTSGNTLIIEKVGRKKISNWRFSVQQTDKVDLNRAENEILLAMIKSIIKAVMAGSVEAHWNESISCPVSNAELKTTFTYPTMQTPSYAELVYELTIDFDGDNRFYRPVALGILSNNDALSYVAFKDLQRLLSPKEVEVLIYRDFNSFVKKTSHLSIE